MVYIIFTPEAEALKKIPICQKLRTSMWEKLGILLLWITLKESEPIHYVIIITYRTLENPKLNCIIIANFLQIWILAEHVHVKVSTQWSTELPK